MTVEWRPRESDSPRCAHLALQTVHVEDPWPDTLVRSVRRLPSLDKVQGSPLYLTSYIVPPCSTRSSSVS